MFFMVFSLKNYKDIAKNFSN